MRRTVSNSIPLTLLALAAIAATTAAPRISASAGVRTAAAVADRGVLARSGVFEILGQGLGPAATPDTPVTLAEVPYPAELAGVTVQILPAASDASAPAVASAYLVSVSDRRIVAILPASVPAGDYRAAVTYNGERSERSAPFKVADSNPGIVWNTGGNGGLARGEILTMTQDENGNEIVSATPLTLASAATPGSTIHLDLTGFGPFESNAGNEPAPENNLFPEAVLLLGDLEIPVSYLGANPSTPGLFRLMVTLPSEGLPSNCLQSVRVRLNSDPATILNGPVYLPLRASEETNCRHPLGVTDEGIATLAAGGNLVRGSFTMVRMLAQTSAGGMTFQAATDALSGGWISYTAEEIAAMTIRSFLAARRDENNCIVEDAFTGTDGGVFVDAGPNVKLTDPAWNLTVARGTGESMNQYNITLNSLLNGQPIPFQTTPKLLFNPGLHNLTGPGGAVVGPFSVDLPVSPVMTWTNMNAVTEIDTSKDLVLLHSGAAPDDTIAASGSVKGPAPEDPSKIVNRLWICYSTGAGGRAVVPASVLQKLPRVSAAELADPRTGRYSSMALASYNPEGVGIFRAPLVDGGISERAVFIFNYTWAKTPVPVR